MVTRAIEKAQGTVESRNAEIRKDVLKYDEVMNEQRKVVYRRRQQILDGADLRDEALSHLETVDRAGGRARSAPPTTPRTGTSRACSTTSRTYFPSSFTTAELEEATGSDQIEESLLAEALRYYEQREEQLGADHMREIERRVMLSIIDQRWREHLYEMDYLQEGINLRAMGQKDPLSEWQREGYEMFGKMIDGISDDFVKFVMHLEVVVEQTPEPALRNVQYSAPEDPVQGSGSVRQAAARGPVGCPGRRSGRGRGCGRRRRHGGHGGPQRAREDRAQPALLVRERQEVQDVPREVAAHPAASSIR